MEKSKRSLALCGIIAAFCLGACISTSDELDLNKQISLDMQIGPGGISIPVGSLDTLFLDSLIKVDGDNSILDTLEGGLFGFTMDGTIDPVKIDIGAVEIKIAQPEIGKISKEIEKPDIPSFDFGPFYSESEIETKTIDLSGINDKLPEFSSVARSENLVFEIPQYAPSLDIDTFLIVVPDEPAGCGFNFEFPEDLASIDSVFLGDDEKGQLVTLKVNLNSFYEVSTSPLIYIKSFFIEFPKEFYLTKSDDIEQYLDGDCHVEGVDGYKNRFVISMAEVNNSVKYENDCILPVSFYVRKLDFSQSTVDFPDSKKGIDYSGDIDYALDLSLSCVTDRKGHVELGVDVSMDEKLHLYDFSVNTNEKSITFEPDSIISPIKVENLKNISEVDTIYFNSGISKLSLSLSDFIITPFSLTDASYIRLSFPEKFGFEHDPYDPDVYVQGAGVGRWRNDSTLDIWPEMLKGKTLMLDVNTLVINDFVDISNPDNPTLNVNNKVKYEASMVIAAAKELNMAKIDAFNETTSDVNSNDRKITFGVTGDLTVDYASVKTSKIEAAFNNVTKLESIEKEVDAALVSVTSIGLEKKATIDMRIKFEGVPKTITEMNLQDTITFPDFLKFDLTQMDPNSGITLKGNQLIIDKILGADDFKNGFAIEGLCISGLEFNPALELKDHKLVIKDKEVKIAGSVTVDKQKVNSHELSEITVEPVVEFDTIKINKVTGRISPEIEPIKQTVSLDMGEDADFLKDLKLNLSDPRITINLFSSVTVPIDLDLSLTSKKKDGTLIADHIGPKNPIRIEACDPADTARTTRIVLGQTLPKTMPDSIAGEMLYVRIDSLSSLMASIPDSILFELVASTDKSRDYTVDLTKGFQVWGGYDVSVPLSFDNLYVSYSDTIGELSKDLEDIADKIEATELQLLADIESTIPLGITLTAKAYDKDWNELTNIIIDSCVVAAGCDTITKSQMVLDVDLQKGGLENLESIVFTAACQSAEGSSSIRKGQWLWIKKMRFKLPQGLKVDLTDSMNNDKDKNKK